MHILGGILWAVDESAINVQWHVHHPLLLPDWNSDGIPDLLVSHGGETHHSTDHDVRQSNYFQLPTTK